MRVRAASQRERGADLRQPRRGQRARARDLARRRSRWTPPLGHGGAAAAAGRARRPRAAAPRSSSRLSTASCTRRRCGRSPRRGHEVGCTAGATSRGRAGRRRERGASERGGTRSPGWASRSPGFRPPGGELTAAAAGAAARHRLPAGARRLGDAAGRARRAGVRPL